MNTKLGTIAPRLLKFRQQFTLYFRLLLVIAMVFIIGWSSFIFLDGIESVRSRYPLELGFSCLYLLCFALSYVSWWRLKLKQTIQVFDKGLTIHRSGEHIDIAFSEVEAVGVIAWSLFYFYMKDGSKHYFNSTLERVDYIWEGIYFARPDLMTKDEYESYRIKLVQYDHHQKRKEWFFKHRLVDVFNWFILPLAFMGIIFWSQSKDVVIYQPFYYFFRLLMYSVLTLLTTAFFYMMIVKKLVFDGKVEDQLGNEPSLKLRDLDYESIIIQRTKLVQSVSVAILFALIIKTDFNMFTLTKIRGDFSLLKLPAGNTLVVDNRYNCLDCKYSINEGDLVVFAKGKLGQVMARAVEAIGEVRENEQGRSIASATIVPAGHVALQLAKQEEMIIIKESELVGKLQN